jgi:hypothetical protein
MTDVHEHRGAFAPLGDALRDLREAEVELRHEQDAAWKRYVARVDEILATDLRAEPTPDDGEVHPLFEGVRSRLDDLRVQARLGAMEGEDLVAQVRTALGHLGEHLPH